MPSILTEHDLKQRMKLPFCYLCGGVLLPVDAINRDHVPPNSIFAKTDRNPPLILPTHCRCNSLQSDHDEQVGQLVRLLHQNDLTPTDLPRLKFTFHRVTKSPVPAGAIRDFNFMGIVSRWLRGFHAALYGEFLPTVGGYIHPPMPEGDAIRREFVPVHPIHAEYVKTIKRNRLAKNTDQIICRNGKLRYECVWAKADDGAMNICVFALDVYNWQVLGDIHHAPARSCVGIYTPDHIPLAAARDTKLIFNFSNRQPLNAFGD